MHEDERYKADEEWWEYQEMMNSSSNNIPKKTSPVPFIVFAIAIILIQLIGGSSWATPISWIGIVVLLILRFIGWL